MVLAHLLFKLDYLLAIQVISEGWDTERRLSAILIQRIALRLRHKCTNQLHGLNWEVYAARVNARWVGLQMCNRQQFSSLTNREEESCNVSGGMVEVTAGESGSLMILECHLHSQSEGITDVKYLSLPVLPHTVLELKRVIQSEFSIPACVQTVAYNTELLTDDVELATRSVRSGDTVDVTFLCRGDCRSLEEVNAWMKNLIQTIIIDDNAYQREVSDHNVEMIVYDGLQSGMDNALGYDLFEWLIPRTMVNKAYFESTGGLHLLLELSQRIFRRKWSSLRVYQKYLESVCIQAFANYGETAGLRRKLLKLGVLELCFKSLLRVTIPPNQRVTDSSSRASEQEANDALLKGELDNALHLLCWCI